MQSALRLAERNRLVVLVVAVVVVGVLVRILAWPATTSAETVDADFTNERRAALLVEPAVTMLEVEWSAWVDHGGAERLPVSFVGTCTGFFVSSDGYLVTAGHCLDPSTAPGGAGLSILQEAVTALFPVYAERFATVDELVEHALTQWEIEGLVAGSSPEREVTVYHEDAVGDLRSGRAYPGRVVDFQSVETGDVGLVKIEQSGVPTVPLGANVGVDVGLPVLSVGFPASVGSVTDFELSPTFKDGRISSVRTTSSYTVFETSAALSGGMSGGPTVDLEGRVIGLNSFLPAGETQAFGFLSSVDLVRELLRRNGVDAGPGPIDASFGAAVEATLGGQHRQALQLLDEVLAESPNHVEATELRAEVLGELRDSPEDDGSYTGWLLVVGLLALGGASGLAVVRSRRSASTQGPVVPAAKPAPSSAAPGDGVAWWEHENSPTIVGGH